MSDHDEGPVSSTPTWLISFGDMMTLFLCFFIVLVTMAAKQDAGLVASGLGPFVAAFETRGMDGVLDGAKKLELVNEYRSRFGLPLLKDEEYMLGAPDSTSAHDVGTLVQSSLKKHGELGQPLVAAFDEGSSTLGAEACRYIDLIANSLRPGHGQTLVLEGHALDGGTALALRRARAVAQRLIDEHGFVTTRVDARAWLDEARELGAHSRGVDARIIDPVEKAE